MTESNVVSLPRPEGDFRDHLSEILRGGAVRLLAQAIEAEVSGFLAAHADLVDEDGRARLVRHGYLPERLIQTGIGPVAITKPRIRDRAATGAEDRITFSSSIIPSYMRRSKSLDELIPALYLRGISTGDVQETLAALLGPQAPNLSAKTVRRLTEDWQTEMAVWRTRDLTAKRYVYIWADGVYLKARMEDDKQCILVLIGATPDGTKELIGFDDGYRESTQSWRELLLDLKARGLAASPKLAIGDGALGFWAALSEIFGTTRHQRCWVHKTANVLNKMPKSLRSKAKGDLRDIWMAESREDADVAFDLFIDKYRAKYDRSVQCLEKDRTALLAFYDFPAEHWKHIRTSNPIESTFATVRHRTVRSKNCLSRKTALPMVFKLVMAAQKRWRALDGAIHLPKLEHGAKFIDGVEQDQKVAA